MLRKTEIRKSYVKNCEHTPRPFEARKGSISIREPKEDMLWSTPEESETYQIEDDRDLSQCISSSHNFSIFVFDFFSFHFDMGN